jgi:polysaccharide export outer membrane protein
VKRLTAILAVFLVASASSWAQETSPSGSKSYSPGLRPGDQIDVRMYDFPDLESGVHIHVDSDGSVHLPYAGTIQVTGMSPRQLEVAISDALLAKGIVKEPNVTVDVASSTALAVTILGQVQSPRAIPVSAPVRLSFVIAQAGGVSGLAAHRLTILHPGGEAPTSIDYDPDQPTMASLNTLVEPGDLVNVSSRGVVFISGEVNRPGIYPLGGTLTIGQVSPLSGEGVVKNMTVLEALSLAGGITPIAARSKMLLLRTVDGKREEITIDQVKLYKGEVADPVLRADDIIFVPTSYFRQQTNNLFSTALSSLYAVVALKQLQ